MRPKSGEHDDHVAPRRAAASAAITASGIFGTKTGHPVTAADACSGKAARNPFDFAGQFTEIHLPARTALIAENNGGLRRVMSQDVCGEVELRVRKKTRAVHYVAVLYRRGVVPQDIEFRETGDC